MLKSSTKEFEANVNKELVLNVELLDIFFEAPNTIVKSILHNFVLFSFRCWK